jgi:hypothetical protein
LIRPILRYGIDALHRPAESVDEITPDVERLIDDMIQTMYAAPGIGLAATQVGVALRIFVVDLSVGRNPNDLLTFVNPEFVEREGPRSQRPGPGGRGNRASRACLSARDGSSGRSRVRGPPARLAEGLDRPSNQKVVARR